MLETCIHRVSRYVFVGFVEIIKIRMLLATNLPSNILSQCLPLIKCSSARTTSFSSLEESITREPTREPISPSRACDLVSTRSRKSSYIAVHQFDDTSWEGDSNSFVTPGANSDVSQVLFLMKRKFFSIQPHWMRTILEQNIPGGIMLPRQDCRCQAQSGDSMRLHLVPSPSIRLATVDRHIGSEIWQMYGRRTFCSSHFGRPARRCETHLHVHRALSVFQHGFENISA